MIIIRPFSFGALQVLAKRLEVVFLSFELGGGVNFARAYLAFLFIVVNGVFIIIIIIADVVIMIILVLFIFIMININHHDHKIIFETQAKYKAQRIGVVMNKGGRMKVPLQWSSTLYFVSGLS